MIRLLYVCVYICSKYKIIYVQNICVYEKGQERRLSDILVNDRNCINLVFGIIEDDGGMLILNFIYTFVLNVLEEDNFVVIFYYKFCLLSYGCQNGSYFD